MSYEILLHEKADKKLSKFDEDLQERIKAGLKKLKEDQKKRGEMLTGSNYRKLRIGDYRAIYEFKEEKGEVVVLFIGHRSKVYGDFSKLL